MTIASTSLFFMVFCFLAFDDASMLLGSDGSQPNDPRLLAGAIASALAPAIPIGIFGLIYGLLMFRFSGRRTKPLGAEIFS